MERKYIRIRGIVQGVGFRPYVAYLARELGLSGVVGNDTEGVYVEIEGDKEDISLFMRRLLAEKPPLAKIEKVEEKEIPCLGSREFIIEASRENGAMNTLIAPDVAPCKTCMEEFYEVGNRRYQYPFINCTHCGPRYSLIRRVPYDRKYTSMADFPMCGSCEKEYTNETSRRYHAEPTCCASCGPRYFVLGEEETYNSVEAIYKTKEAIENGKIAAVKGIGGYHLVCDATNEDAVKELRKRKQRPEKPLAMMAGSLDYVKELCYVSAKEEEVLTSKERPIVLLKRKKRGIIAPSVAKDTTYVGIMLPYASLHELLLNTSSLYVMTSANASNAPVLFEDEVAFKELPLYSDILLYNNRKIEAPVDDSLVMVVHEDVHIMRRARGYVPLPVYMQDGDEHVQAFAVGADLKNTFAFQKGKAVFVGPHMGDLENESTLSRYVQAAEHIKKMFDITPQYIVADAHPNYMSRGLGEALARKWQVPIHYVGHHKAHVASVLAALDTNKKYLALAFDGTGYGDDGAIWGGEAFAYEEGIFTRRAQLSYAALPGGDIAVKEPWRQALWYMHKVYGAEGKELFAGWFKTLPKGYSWLLEAMQGDFPMTKTSSMGRLFDTVGSLLGLGHVHGYEGHIAMLLEQVAGEVTGEVYSYEVIEENGYYQIDTMSIVRSILQDIQEGKDKEKIAANFHDTLVEVWLSILRKLRKQMDTQEVLVSGGVFQNRRILGTLKEKGKDFTFLHQKDVPSNDGGLAMGQLWLAQNIQSKRIKRGITRCV